MKKEIKILIYLILFEVFIFILQILEKIKPQNVILVLSVFTVIFSFYCFEIYMIEIKSKNENRRKDFISNLIHDFKNPITAQIKISELLLAESFGELTQKQSEIIKEIKNSCEYMNSLIHTVFDTYINKNGEIELAYNQINIKKLSENIISEISCLLENKKQNIIIKSNLKEETIKADMLQLKRVITNLISNAITHGERNSDIYIMLDEDSENVIFSVKNKAHLKNQKALGKMFQKYKTTKQNDKKGNGLGLYLSQKIIKKHKGKMFITSSQDNFCTFGFIIPKEQEKELHLRELISHEQNFY